MLFDLGGKRKRFIQVIYVMLALLMGGGLVLFGIGGDANGGLFDALGIGSNSTATTNPDFEQQIDKANETLATDPEDEKALLSLTRYEFLTAQDQLDTDEETGQQSLTEDALNSYQASVDAWERYLATNPEPPDDDVASLALRAYEATIDPSSPAIFDELDKLVTAAQVIADGRPGLVNYITLLNYAAIAGNEKVVAETRKKALAEAADDAERKQVDQVVKQAEATRVTIKQQLKGTGPESNQLDDPTAGLGTGSSPLLPSAGTTTAPAP